MSNPFVTVRYPALFLLALQALSGEMLKPPTERFYQEHLKQFESSLEKRQRFLRIDAIEGMKGKVRAGHVYIKNERARKEPPDGLIHHWEGAVFIPGVTVGQVLGLIQDYDRHKKLYAPEVIDSKTLRRDGNRFQVRLRLLKKKVMTVVLETEHAIEYKPINATRWESVAHTTKVSEVDDAGSAREKEQAPGHGHGFVWRLDSYWRFEQADGGVYVECSSLTLSRDAPLFFTPMIRPIIDNLPEESLRGVLTKTRDALKR
ncbi:MAG: hypothetical protein HY820_04360 [Acidobacteria bacterium]|nr:hypothetical protein [Acidobacteriota bacterium]